MAEGKSSSGGPENNTIASILRFGLISIFSSSEYEWLEKVITHQVGISSSITKVLPTVAEFKEYERYVFFLIRKSQLITILDVFLHNPPILLVHATSVKPLLPL